MTFEDTVTWGRTNPQKKSGDVKLHVSVQPRQGGEKTEMWWTADSGVRRTLLAARDWLKLQEKNPDLKFKRNHVEFRPYGIKIILLVHGKVKVLLKCENGEKKNSMAYLGRDQRESLLGRLDLEALGIIVLPRGKEVIKAVTMMTKSPSIAEDQEVSGGKTQNVIDRNMRNGAGCSHPGGGPTEHRGGQDADEFGRGRAEGQVEW